MIDTTKRVEILVTEGLHAGVGKLSIISLNISEVSFGLAGMSGDLSRLLIKSNITIIAVLTYYPLAGKATGKFTFEGNEYQFVIIITPRKFNEITSLP